MRQTVAVGVIKSVEKTDKSGGKGKCNALCVHEYVLMVLLQSPSRLRRPPRRSKRARCGCPFLDCTLHLSRSYCILSCIVTHSSFFLFLSWHDMQCCTYTITRMAATARSCQVVGVAVARFVVSVAMYSYEQCRAQLKSIVEHYLVSSSDHLYSASAK
jgi:hypothetical protein